MHYNLLNIYHTEQHTRTTFA